MVIVLLAIPLFSVASQLGDAGDTDEMWSSLGGLVGVVAGVVLVGGVIVVVAGMLIPSRRQARRSEKGRERNPGSSD